jgi:PAS domain S-box-containing protein
MVDHPSKTNLNDILIVDDELSNLKLLSELLEREGYRVRPTNNPKLAIDSALECSPKLILLDVMMPQMNGFEVCRHLKQDERTRDIPVIFISALKDMADKVQGFEAGGVDFIIKPFEKIEVIARVLTHMDLRNMQLNLEKIVEERTVELGKSEIRYRGLVENSIVGVFRSTPDGQFEFVNNALVRMFDFENLELMIAQGSLERWRDLSERDRLMAELQKHGSVTNFEAEVITNTDRYIHVLFSVKLIENTIFGMVMDITKRKQSEKKIIEYQKRLKALAYKLTIAEEKERRSIAADLHDHVGQSLALARIQLASARKLTSKGKLTAKLDEISDTLHKTLEVTETLMLELSSHSIHETDLSAAISAWLEGDLRNKHHMKIQVIDNIPKNQQSTLSHDTLTILFRNMRELVINVVKHARANKVSICLELEENHILVIIEDDGIGFDPYGKKDAKHKVGGFGLFSIKELMLDLNGSLKIVSGPGKGCMAILSAPFMVNDNKEMD